MFEWIQNSKEMIAVLVTVASFLFGIFSTFFAIWMFRTVENRLLGPRQKYNLAPRVHSPAATAELVLHLLLKADEAEAVGGDLQERYSKKVERLGKRRAYIWLWSQVLRSIWPLLKRFFTAGGFLAAAEFIRRLMS